MYPATYFALFPPFARDNRCFVAMSFDPRFDRRWIDVIAPAVVGAFDGDAALVPHRIDLSRRGDSILTEILAEVARCRLIIADITSIGSVNDKPVRNANVLYELGLAHSTRSAEEVIVLRSDEDPLPFDVANVRVHSYSPDADSETACCFVRDLVREALNSVDSLRSDTVARVAERLDFECWDALYAIASTGPIGHPGRTDVVEAKMGVLQAVSRIGGLQRLLDLGAIRASLQKVTPRHIGGYSDLPRQDLFRYAMTPFGEALLHYCLTHMDYFSAPVREAFARLREKHL